VGRTGHFILIQLILQLFVRNEIFSTSQDCVARKYLELVDQIRKTRPGLIWGIEQFEMAIHNAFVLYEYAIEKGYTLEAQFTPVLKPTPTPNWNPLNPSKNTEHSISCGRFFNRKTVVAVATALTVTAAVAVATLT
jgi:hypothetical protein